MGDIITFGEIDQLQARVAELERELQRADVRERMMAKRGDEYADALVACDARADAAEAQVRVVREALECAAHMLETVADELPGGFGGVVGRLRYGASRARRDIAKADSSKVKPEVAGPFATGPAAEPGDQERVDLYNHAHASGRRDERRRIIKWLRASFAAMSETRSREVVMDTADAIEAMPPLPTTPRLPEDEAEAPKGGAVIGEAMSTPRITVMISEDGRERLATMPELAALLAPHIVAVETLTTYLQKFFPIQTRKPTPTDGKERR